MTHATGAFEVKLTPQPAQEKAASPILGRISIEKRFHGDLEGTSEGEMLTAGTDVKGSAGYVAMERVSATLHGRRGTLDLQHYGTLTRGAPQLTIREVPDSATRDGKFSFSQNSMLASEAAQEIGLPPPVER
jgi:hypothetical protein